MCLLLWQFYGVKCIVFHTLPFMGFTKANRFTSMSSLRNMALRKLISVIVCEIVHLAVNVNETLFSNVLKHGFSLDSVRS